MLRTRQASGETRGERSLRPRDVWPATAARASPELARAPESMALEASGSSVRPIVADKRVSSFCPAVPSSPSVRGHAPTAAWPRRAGSLPHSPRRADAPSTAVGRSVARPPYVSCAITSTVSAAFQRTPRPTLVSRTRATVATVPTLVWPSAKGGRRMASACGAPGATPTRRAAKRNPVKERGSARRATLSMRPKDGSQTRVDARHMPTTSIRRRPPREIVASASAFGVQKTGTNPPIYTRMSSP